MTMEKRLYFIIGDLLANMFVANAVVALTAWLIGGSWGMGAGMLAGMLIGMALSLVLSVVLLVPVLGAMEIIVPCMLSGMLAGMWGGMWPLDRAGVLQWGVGTGIAVFVLIYALNVVMTGPQKARN